MVRLLHGEWCVKFVAVAPPGCPGWKVPEAVASDLGRQHGEGMIISFKVCYLAWLPASASSAAAKTTARPSTWAVGVIPQVCAKNC